MKLVHVDETPKQHWTNIGRGGETDSRTVFTGDAGPGNFALTIFYHHASYTNPRHRHNFDQFRYQLEGTETYGAEGEMTPGMLGYFPEGAFYGPQSAQNVAIAILQFDGPRGRGYFAPSEEINSKALQELRKTGVFEKGVYKRNEGEEGRRNQDAAEAIWEHIYKQKLVYPKPQYDRWIRMDTNNYPWLPTERTSVSERAFGTFSSAKMKAASYKLEPTSSLTLDGRCVVIVLSGQGTVERQAYRDQTCVYLADDERATYTAQSVTELLLLGLPSYAYLRAADAPPRYEATPEAP